MHDPSFDRHRSRVSRLAAASFRIFGLVALAIVPNAAAHASVFVSAADPYLTPLAVLLSGQTYKVEASGVADLLESFNGGKGATFTPDGKPTYAFPSPLDSFDPNGSAVDPQNGANGQAGPGKLFGALVGTLTEHPASYSDIFTIGSNLFIKASMNEVLYGGINDDDYSNNDPLSGYTVTVTAVGSVPLPSAFPLFGIAILTCVGLSYGTKRLKLQRSEV